MGGIKPWEGLNHVNKKGDQYYWAFVWMREFIYLSLLHV